MFGGRPASVEIGHCKYGKSFCYGNGGRGKYFQLWGLAPWLNYQNSYRAGLLNVNKD